MSSEIKIYWSPIDMHAMNAANQNEPRGNLIREWAGHEVMHCPSWRKYWNNVFSIDCRFNINLLFNRDEERWVTTSDYLNHHVPTTYPYDNINIKKLIFNMQYPLYFLPDVDDLEVEIMHPFLSHNEWSNAIDVIPGNFNMGAYPRNMGYAFTIRDDLKQEYNIKEGDSLYYIRFKTNKKIKFIPFFFTEEIKALHKGAQIGRRLNSLQKFYDNYKKFRVKKLIMKEIQKQL
jgi:hypothetical protein